MRERDRERDRERERERDRERDRERETERETEVRIDGETNIYIHKFIDTYIIHLERDSLRKKERKSYIQQEIQA